MLNTFLKLFRYPRLKFRVSQTLPLPWYLLHSEAFLFYDTTHAALTKCFAPLSLRHHIFFLGWRRRTKKFPAKQVGCYNVSQKKLFVWHKCIHSPNRFRLHSQQNFEQLKPLSWGSKNVLSRVVITWCYDDFMWCWETWIMTTILSSIKEEDNLASRSEGN